MGHLLDLTNKSPQEWDAAIAAELKEAGITEAKFREYDSPNYWPKHTLKGALGKWVFSRDDLTYSFWGDVPLASAEVIAANKACAEGCMPGQWLARWGNRPDPAIKHAKYAERITWIDGENVMLVKDEGWTKEYKDCMQKDANWMLRFVDNPTDPKEGAKPYITTYTFFTTEALKSFVEIVRRHRVDFSRVH